MISSGLRSAVEKIPHKIAFHRHFKVQVHLSSVNSQIHKNIFVLYDPNHPVIIHCGRKLEYPENAHDFRQSVGQLFSHKRHASEVRIKPTILELKSACSDDYAFETPRFSNGAKFSLRASCANMRTASFEFSSPSNIRSVVKILRFVFSPNIVPITSTIFAQKNFNRLDMTHSGTWY